MGRAVVALLLLLVVAAAQEDKRVAELLLQANGKYAAAKETWNRFVFTASEVTDDQLAEMLAQYDQAIELCQKATETADVPEADTMVLRLARRTAQLRATIFARVMRARAEEARREQKPAEGEPEKPPAEEKPEPKSPEEAPARAPEAAPEPTFPEISETKAQRTQGIQSARTFLMNFYFANRRRDALIDQCANCNGKGIVYLPYRDPKTQKPAKQACGGCGGTGYHLNEPVARKGLWLCWSPLHRQGGKTQWEQDLMTYRSDPRQIPEFLKSLRIAKLDYSGLWADVEWEEKGTTADGKKFTREVSRKLVRAGRQWFFFDPESDKGMFSGKPEAD